MANIDTYLAAIMAAIYGRDVRSSIHDAIQAINEETESFIQGDLDTTLTSSTLPAQGKAVGDRFGQALAMKDSLTSVDDLDTLTGTGFYIIPRAAADAPANVPESASGYKILLTFQAPNGSIRHQIYINTTSHAMYARVRNNYGKPSYSWDPWASLPLLEMDSTLTSATLPAPAVLLGTDFLHRGDTITSGADLNDLTGPKWYIIQTAAAVSNGPDEDQATGYRIVFVFTGANANFKHMLYINRTSGYIGMRLNPNTSWQAWETITPGLAGLAPYTETPVRDQPMIDICHRGYTAAAPENSLLAYKQAKAHGYDWIETDIQFTSDGFPVMLHDRDISKIAQRDDGTALPTPTYIDTITLSTVQMYDFGAKSGYPGVRIATLDEALYTMRRCNLSAILHFKETVNTADKRRMIYGHVRDNGMFNNVVFMSGNKSYLTAISKEVSGARIALSNDVSFCDSTLLPYIKSLQVNNNTVWLTSNPALHRAGVMEFVNYVQAAGFTVTVRADNADECREYVEQWGSVFITSGANNFKPSEYIYNQMMAEVSTTEATEATEATE